MRQSQFNQLFDRGCPLELLVRLVEPGAAKRSPTTRADPELPAPAPRSFPAANIPQSALAVSSSEPKRQYELVDLAPAYSVRLWCALNDAVISGLHMGCFEGIRTPERQVWLYSQGRIHPGSIVTNAATVHASWHGYGLAADCTPIIKGEYAWPTDEAPIWLRWLGHATKYALTTGVHWLRPVDAPHTQPRFISSYPKLSDKLLLSNGGLLAVWQKYDQLTLSDSFFDLL